MRCRTMLLKHMKCRHRPSQWHRRHRRRRTRSAATRRATVSSVSRGRLCGIGGGCTRGRDKESIVSTDARYRSVPRCPAENECSKNDCDSTQRFAGPVLFFLLLLPAQSLGLSTRVAATVARHDEVPERRNRHTR